VTLSYALELDDKGLKALQTNTSLRRGLNTIQGKVVHPGVATAFNLPCANVEEVLASTTL